MRSAVRAMDVMELLARQPTPLQAATVARLCGIPRSSAYRLLNALAERDFVASTGAGRWRLGERLGEIGTAAPSIAEGFTVLEALSGRPTGALPAELARQTGLFVPSVERALEALAEEGAVDARADGTYVLGTRVPMLAMKSHLLDEIREAARPVLAALRERTGETANLLVRERRHAVYVEQDRRQALRRIDWVGRRIPLEGSASGKALSRREAIAVVRDAVEPGVTAVAGCVASQGGEAPNLALSLTAPSWRLDDAAIRQVERVVADACVELGRRLYHGNRAASPSGD
ncbi:MAG: helix-turn-helix domain-containing protein [Actinobacteria bacterium]|nr:helix-turn-helix domain-containing protein [Actinomycetota bacterium]